MDYDDPVFRLDDLQKALKRLPRYDYDLSTAVPKKTRQGKYLLAADVLRLVKESES